MTCSVTIKNFIKQRPLEISQDMIRSIMIFFKQRSLEILNNDPYGAKKFLNNDPYKNFKQ